MKKIIKSKEIIRKATKNTNNAKSEKYGLESEVIKKMFKVWCFRIKFDFHWLDKVKKDSDRKKRHAKNWQKKKIKVNWKTQDRW